MTVEHSDIQFGEMHPVANWIVTSGGVAALGSIPVGDGDIGKQAWVAGVGHYTLAATNPVVWEASSVTISSFVYNGGTGDLTITLSSGATLQVTIPLGLSVADANDLIADALATLTTANIPPSADRNYVTDAQLTVVGNTSGTNSGDETQASIKTKLGAASSIADGYITAANFTSFDAAYSHSQVTGNPHGTAITDISGLSTALAGKEPTIASGTSTQYIRGDKSLATLNTDAVPETANHVYLSPAQKTVATQAATATLSGYLSSTDWSTFNSKKSLPEVKSASFTAEINKAYSLGTPTATLNIQFPTGTVTGQEIVTHINRAALTYTVFAVPAAGQHVVYVGAGTYQITSGLCDHILRWVFNSSTSVWEMLEIVPAGSISDVIAFCSSTNIQSRLKFNLPTATGTYQWYTPAKDINFGNLSSVATTDNNALSAGHIRCRILGGNNNTLSGTNNTAVGCTYTSLNNTNVVAIGCANFTATGAAFTSCTFVGSNPALITAATKSIMLGMRNSYMQTNPVTGSLFLGASDNPDLFTYPVAAATVVNNLFASSDSVPVSGTLYATTNGSQTLSSDNCLPIPISCGTAQYEVDFIVSVGAVGLASTSCNATGCIAMRRIFTVFKNNAGAATISTVDTVGTDRTLGAIGGTFTPTIALSGTTHVTLGITRASGAAGQEAMAISARVRAHLTR